MTQWVVDRGLDVLLAQINALAPLRSKASDGSIGDAAHAGTVSEHNPESPPPPGNPDRQVDARDFTHDPRNGADMGEVSEAIRLSKDRRVLYVIFNRRIFSGRGGPQPWVWRTYTGTNPHDKHMHVSVRDDTSDQAHNWQIQVRATEVPSMFLAILKGTVFMCAGGRYWPSPEGQTAARWRTLGLRELSVSSEEELRKVGGAPLHEPVQLQLSELDRSKIVEAVLAKLPTAGDIVRELVSLASPPRE